MSKNTVVCSVCGFPEVPVKEGKGGSWSGKCPALDCGAQILVRSPSGAAKMKSRFDGGSSPVSKSADDLLKI